MIMNETVPANASGYGKRPLWQWILIYVIVGGIVYFLVYYFVFAKKGYGGSRQPYNYSGGQQQSTPSTPSVPPSPPAPSTPSAPAQPYGY